MPHSASHRNTAGVSEVIVGAGGVVMVSVAPLKAQFVAPLEQLHPDPVIVTVPAATPVTVEPETVATAVLLVVNVPPVHPDGAEAVLVPPTVTVAEFNDTAPVGQSGGGGVMIPPVEPPQERSPAAQRRLKVGRIVPASGYIIEYGYSYSQYLA
jgi:hypothetical protein